MNQVLQHFDRCYSLWASSTTRSPLTTASFLLTLVSLIILSLTLLHSLLIIPYLNRNLLLQHLFLYFWTCYDLIFVSLYACVLHCLLLVAGADLIHKYADGMEWDTLKSHATAVNASLIITLCIDYNKNEWITALLVFYLACILMSNGSEPHV